MNLEWFYIYPVWRSGPIKTLLGSSTCSFFQRTNVIWIALPCIERTRSGILLIFKVINHDIDYFRAGGMVTSGAFSAPHSSFVCNREEFEFKFEDTLILHNRWKTHFRLQSKPKSGSVWPNYAWGAFRYLSIFSQVRVFHSSSGFQSEAMMCLGFSLCFVLLSCSRTLMLRSSSWVEFWWWLSLRSGNCLSFVYPR